MSHTLKIGSYTASVEFDYDADLYVGVVNGTGAPVIFYAASESELLIEFDKSLKLYIELNNGVH